MQHNAAINMQISKIPLILYFDGVDIRMVYEEETSISVDVQLAGLNLTSPNLSSE